MESPDASGITTAKEYNYVPAQKLPPVQGISSYKPLADRTVLPGIFRRNLPV